MASYANILHVIVYTAIHYAAALYFQLYRDCVNVSFVCSFHPCCAQE